MKVYIWKDERWPDYGVSLHEPPNAEITEELWAWYTAVNAQYDKMQQALKEALQKGLDEQKAKVI